MNGSVIYSKITNKCRERVKIWLRSVIVLKPSKRRKTKRHIILLPNQESDWIKKSRLIGAPNWDVIKDSPCIIIEDRKHEPQFFYIKNLGKTPLLIPIKPVVPKDVVAEYPAQKRVVVVKPGAVSRALDKRSIQKPGKLQELILAKKVLVGAADIGPGREGTYGSYDGEDVYICYECGGPIVFRGSPPRPVHI